VEKKQPGMRNRKLWYIPSNSGPAPHGVHTPHRIARNSSTNLSSKPVDWPGYLVCALALCASARGHLNSGAVSCSGCIICVKPCSPCSDRRSSHAGAWWHIELAMDTMFGLVIDEAKNWSTAIPLWEKDVYLTETPEGSWKKYFLGPSEYTSRGWRCPYLLPARLLTTK
jgi:hypothetical protein